MATEGRPYGLFASMIFVGASVLYPTVVFGQTRTLIFSGDRIGHGDGQSRVIRKAIRFPEFASTDQITLDWDILADQDPWDRAGSLHAILPGGKQVQLGKFVTGFKGTTSHSMDISDLAPMLSGQAVRLEAFVDTWVPDAWRFTASVTSLPGTEANPTWYTPVISRDTGFGRGAGGGTRTQDYTIEVPEDMSNVVLTYFASGHHETQTNNSDEFNQRMHSIKVDGVSVWSDIPWRTDGPSFRSVNPTSGRWDGNGDGDTSDPYPIDYWSSDFARSGWVPGDEVVPYKIDLTPYLSEAGTHTVSLTIDDMDANSFWRVSAFLSGTPEANGDFDFDGDVDGADFLFWQRESTTSGPPGLATWQSNYGDTGNAVSSVATVPEPSAVVLVGCSVLLWGLLRNTRRPFG